jgi:hypothetical protein
MSAAVFEIGHRGKGNVMASQICAFSSEILQFVNLSRHPHDASVAAANDCEARGGPVYWRAVLSARQPDVVPLLVMMDDRDETITVLLPDRCRPRVAAPICACDSGLRLFARFDGSPM